jgi:hypothetical protein
MAEVKKDTPKYIVVVLFCLHVMGFTGLRDKEEEYQNVTVAAMGCNNQAS